MPEAVASAKSSQLQNFKLVDPSLGFLLCKCFETLVGKLEVISPHLKPWIGIEKSLDLHIKSRIFHFKELYRYLLVVNC